ISGIEEFFHADGSDVARPTRNKDIHARSTYSCPPIRLKCFCHADFVVFSARRAPQITQTVLPFRDIASPQWLCYIMRSSCPIHPPLCHVLKCAVSVAASVRQKHCAALICPCNPAK